VTIGPKPTLEQAEYDADKFEANLLEWTEKKRKADEIQNKAKEAQEAMNKAWQEKQTAYEKSKTTLRVKDYADAEDAVREALTVEQQSVILDAVDIPAEMVYAIGKRPKLLKELSEIKSLAKFAAKLGVLETKMKVERRTPPAPERVVKSGAATGSAISSSALDKLREEAHRSGDMTKYLEAKRRLKK